MVGLVVALMFVAWAGLALGQSSIDALLFARYGVDLLPLLYVLLGVLSAVVSLVVTGVLQATPPRALFVTIPLVLAVLLVLGQVLRSPAEQPRCTGPCGFLPVLPFSSKASTSGELPGW